LLSYGPGHIRPPAFGAFFEPHIPNVYVEPRLKGSGPIKEYVVEDRANHALHAPFKTQQAAVE
jgi:hypothetical protein